MESTQETENEMVVHNERNGDDDRKPEVWVYFLNC